MRFDPPPHKKIPRLISQLPVRRLARRRLRKLDQRDNLAARRDRGRGVLGLQRSAGRQGRPVRERAGASEGPPGGKAGGRVPVRHRGRDRLRPEHVLRENVVPWWVTGGRVGVLFL